MKTSLRAAPSRRVVAAGAAASPVRVQQPDPPASAVVELRPDEACLDEGVAALLARLRARDVATPVRTFCIAATPTRLVSLGNRRVPILVVDEAGRLLGAAGPRQLAEGAGQHAVVAEAMVPAMRLQVVWGGDPAVALAVPLMRDGFAIVRWRGRLFAAELDDLRHQAHVFHMLADWGRARFG